jgi:hypothetical protein
MERKRAAPILCVWIRPGVEKRLDDAGLEGRRREVERRVADVELVRHLRHEATGGDTLGSELGEPSDEAASLRLIAHDQSEKVVEGGFPARHGRTLKHRALSTIALDDF